MKSSFAHISKEKDGYKLVFERELNASAEKVWKALTEPEELKYWFADIEIDLKKGGRIIIHFKDANKTTSFAKITGISEGNKMEWDWEGEIAEWKIYPLSENTTKLEFTYSKVHESYIRNVAAGFHSILDLLEQRLEGSEKLNEFGANENDPETVKLKAHYDFILLKNHPDAVSNKPLEVHTNFNSSLNDLWLALTDINKIKEWYFPLTEFRAEKGFKFQFEGQGSSGKKHLHLAEITFVVPFKSLQYSWVYEGIPGYSLLHWEVKGNESESALTVSHFGLESFQTNDPDFHPQNFKTGWNEILNVSLKNFLEKK